MMIDTMNSHIKMNKSVAESALLGASEIVGATITTLVGLIPLALSDALCFHFVWRSYLV